MGAGNMRCVGKIYCKGLQCNKLGDHRCVEPGGVVLARSLSEL